MSSLLLSGRAPFGCGTGMAGLSYHRGPLTGAANRCAYQRRACSPTRFFSLGYVPHEGVMVQEKV